MKPNTSQSVTARVETMVIPTYAILDAEPNPLFFETRNVQGSKGNIYPHPYIDQISNHRVDHAYQAVVLENEYIYLVLLPELGGRIFIGQDKTNGYDFFYRHQVIKPALIATFGPWISGGVEFNWPQHHRPTTYDPTDFTVEEGPDGSKTVWMGEHEPLNRTKGMVGITLYPGKAFVETKVRLFNRTPLPQTFLWWANAGVAINEKYQVVFPPDVHHAVFHSKKPVIAYPIAKGPFYGNDYGDGTDISFWANSPGATSFFAAESKYEFFGGYDHLRESGVVHVADAGISGGKKYFTWANGPFGHQWQRNLYDAPEEGEPEEGEYLELMAGVFTDNQPDFSWIMPYETRAFSQFWFPVQQIGPMKNANLQAAVNLEVREGQATLGVYATEIFQGAAVSLTAKGQSLFVGPADLAPGQPFTQAVALPAGTLETDLLLSLSDASGAEIIRYQPEGAWDGKLPEAYAPPAEPAAIETIEELFLAGLHLEQYRHPGIAPETYWQEALRRDPADSRTNLGMGKLRLRCGDFAAAEAHFRAAIARLTARNFNPYDGEAHYNLGLALQYQGRLDEAYKAFYKAAWNYAWQSASFYGLAQIDLVRKNFAKALDHLERSRQVNTLNPKARGLQAALLRRLGQAGQAAALAAESIRLDPLDFWARYELALSNPVDEAERLAEMKILMRDEVQTYLDIALDYAQAGLDEEAGSLLRIAAGFTRKGHAASGALWEDGPHEGSLHPMVAYTLSFLACRAGDHAMAADWQAKGTQASPAYCFPWRLEEMIILQDILRHHPDDARASFYLGNLLYDKKQYAEAVRLWQTAAGLEPGFSIPWRNLGLATYNLTKDIEAALNYYEKAMAANPGDARLLLEQDTLMQRAGAAPEARLAHYLSRREVVAKRDDLTMELMALYNRTGQPEKALEISLDRSFHPWEGGEGAVARQYACAHWLIGRKALESGDAANALSHFKAGLDLPVNLGEVSTEAEIVLLSYYTALACAALGNQADAQAAFAAILGLKSESLLVDAYKGLALLKLGPVENGRARLAKIKAHAAELAKTGLQPDYFFYGHPNPIFNEDPGQHSSDFILVVGLASLGLDDLSSAKHAFNEVLAADPANLLAYEENKRLG